MALALARRGAMVHGGTRAHGAANMPWSKWRGVDVAQCRAMSRNACIYRKTLQRVVTRTSRNARGKTMRVTRNTYPSGNH
eukprot:2623564-Lingulodinium_polyedra.AAC.1